ncbi:DNA-binding protein, putative [Eimeria tenella]|uniref:DNA-binding protein, putative n=1 Tax=Eimeria tenella TaxID=5802 RepID=U6KQ47_EIMTE|nr:DNA-binding protein, putative [Eimeria tenella]CDJ38387.1 DNA-binding protein, putative [Eimeria tenella]|eukprot:XP_013229225.1 DNA-binding protein, putative [Eimeria tenella]
MLDYCCCFTRGGVLLWGFCFSKAPLKSLCQLIENVLLEERAGSSSANFGGLSFQWVCLNPLQLFFAAAYSGLRNVALVDLLLQQTAAAFAQHVHGLSDMLDYPLKVGGGPDPFDETFLHILARAQQKRQEAPLQQQQQQQQQRQQQQQHGRNRETKQAKKTKDKGGSPKAAAAAGYWTENKVTKKSMEALDYSKKTGNGDEAAHAIERKTYGADSDSQSSEEETEAAAAAAAATAEGSWLSFLPKSLQKIAAKNVAEEVTDLLLLSVKKNLLGTRTPTLVSVHQTVKRAVKEAIVKLLTPKRSVDVLGLCLQARAEGRVFSIVFLGINGVGKSTNLAKVAYYLKHVSSSSSSSRSSSSSSGSSCSSKRRSSSSRSSSNCRGNSKRSSSSSSSHSSSSSSSSSNSSNLHAGLCLEIPLFEKGYGKDAAAICKEALAHAKETGADVVLVDTAGRMQDNEPLMRALAKLVDLNNPDLILFVGEALVGNDGVDQLKKFNQALANNPTKVGAALSMAYITGQPIVFVGTGQKYQNLKRLNGRGESQQQQQQQQQQQRWRCCCCSWDACMRNECMRQEQLRCMHAAAAALPD